MNRIATTFLGFAILAVLGLAFVWLRQEQPTSDVTAASSVEEVSQTATTGLVGREVCGECHRENYLLHGQSGHASTFALTRESEVAKNFAGKTMDAGEPYGNFNYSFEDEGLLARRARNPDATPFLLQYALGSGHNAVTFISLLDTLNNDTVGVEHRVSWFAADNIFGLTPGQMGESPQTEIEYYGKTFHGESMHRCVDCHTTSGNIVDGKIIDLVANVNCEKCHGPGAEHVRQARLYDKPPPYSVGRDDWNEESELQLCGSCHRMPQDISPRELREYPSSLARFQPVGMLRSKCYLESEGEMKCSTCHNPHMNFTSKSKEAYVMDCVKCHMENSASHVSCPVSPVENCIECHMPPLKFEQGMIFHDHWIRIRSDG